MKTNGEQGTVGGWKAPCAPFDYEKMEREALGECEAIKERLRALRAAAPGDADSDLILRRDICVLTDIFYEQRHKAQLFHRRAEERREHSARSEACL